MPDYQYEYAPHDTVWILETLIGAWHDMTTANFEVFQKQMTAIGYTFDDITPKAPKTK